MVQSVSMLAPVAGATYVAKSGNSYVAASNGLITGVLPGDIDNLTNEGCTIVGPPRPVNAVPVSTSSAIYVAQGLINTIAASTFTVAALLAAPAVIGQRTVLNSLSTGNTTITSSGATILSEKGVACTVLTCGLGVAELDAVGSTLYQLVSRSINTSSDGAVYGILSS